MANVTQGQIAQDLRIFTLAHGQLIREIQGCWPAQFWPTQTRKCARSGAWNSTVGYSAKAVANYFLAQHGKHGLSPLKLQKLVYIAHGWNLALRDQPLVDNETPEAWGYGPVFASLHHEYKHRGSLPIFDLARDVSLDLIETTPVVHESDTETRALLDRIWEVYGGYTAAQLSNMCHQPGSPWAQVKSESRDLMNAQIDNEIIKAYYREKRDRNRQRNG